jgi:FolB domain-containing protein
VTLWTDTRKVDTADNIDNCVNYRTVAKKLYTHTEKIGRFTVEALAEDLARLCLEENGVRKVRISVEKPGAVRFSRSAGVQIERNSQA